MIECRGLEAGLVADLEKAPLLVVVLPEGEIVLPEVVVVPDDAAPVWKSTSVSRRCVERVDQQAGKKVKNWCSNASGSGFCR